METRFRQLSRTSLRHQPKPFLVMGGENTDRIIFVDEDGYPITVVAMADYHEYVRNQACSAMASRNYESLPLMRSADTYIPGLFVG
ncbi:MAG: hypothetical protein K8R88_14185 [Armatimonadetes bacterium]|nr:hypothetical protein [Armatimonadota bacterium]